MKIVKKTFEYIKKRTYFNDVVLFSLFFLLCFFQLNAQDSIPEAKDLTEEKELKFQQFFFKALSEKSIGNYQKAIENLEDCNQILEENTAVFFELSKNYLLLNDIFLAKKYIEKALVKYKSNIWMLTHLVNVYKKERNFSEAILIQQKITEINPKKRDYLVRLYLQNNNYNKANLLLQQLEDEQLLTPSLRVLKNNLAKRTKKVIIKKTTVTSGTLIEQFETNKSYIILKKILEENNTNLDVLLQYSKEGLSIFPAQPYVYLTNGRVLNKLKKYKEALTVLKSGIDFVIEDEMEANFYNEIAIAYKGLGNLEEEENYMQKAKKIKS